MLGRGDLVPGHITVESNGYYERNTFKDRPGVSWMLYLPRVLTAQQVPEARALVPVMSLDRTKGTIIVSHAAASPANGPDTGPGHRLA